MVMDKASPPVSPPVVAAILITRKANVTSGTLFIMNCLGVLTCGEDTRRCFDLVASPVSSSAETVSCHPFDGRTSVMLDSIADLCRRSSLEVNSSENDVTIERVPPSQYTISQCSDLATSRPQFPLLVRPPANAVTGTVDITCCEVWTLRRDLWPLRICR